jgi:hypothetical protein
MIDHGYRYLLIGVPKDGHECGRMITTRSKTSTPMILINLSIYSP